MPKGRRENVVREVFMRTGVGSRNSVTWYRMRGDGVGCLGVVFFGATKGRKRNRVHRKRVARIKHGGGHGYDSDRGKWRSRERMEYGRQNRERSSKKNRHVIMVIGIRWKRVWGILNDLGEPQKAHMYTVHIRMEGG